MTRVNLLGVRVSAFDLPAATVDMAQAVDAQRRVYASTCPVYTLMQGHERADVRQALNGAEWVTPDGMPVVWALRLLGPSPAPTDQHTSRRAALSGETSPGARRVHVSGRRDSRSWYQPTRARATRRRAGSERSNARSTSRVAASPS